MQDNKKSEKRASVYSQFRVHEEGKKLYVGNYSGVKVVYMVSGGYNFAGFRHGINMIRELQGSDQVVRLVGYCNEKNRLQQVSAEFLY